MLLLALAILCLAQPLNDDAWLFGEPIDPGTGDLGLLGQSFRLPMDDLRLPDAWDRVYRLPTDSGELFARRNGSLTAIFPRSDYASGSLPVVPPDTVYVIGDPPPWIVRQFGLRTDQPIHPHLMTRLDLSLDPRMPPQRQDQRQPNPLDQPTHAETLEQARRAASIWYNDQLRQHRIATLLAQASHVR